MPLSSSRRRACDPRRSAWVWAGAVALGPLLAAVSGAAGDRVRDERAWFPDRPIAWLEHDDQDVTGTLAPTHLQDQPNTLILRDSVAGEVDRYLALDPGRPAQDVNALDEVPCSTWFCPRNHLMPMSPEAVAAGPPAAVPPRPPLRIIKGKDEGASAGFQVKDADGRRYMLKMDPAGHLGLLTGAEMIGERIFHAAGYNVPGAFLLDLAPSDLALDPQATFRLFGVQKRPLTASRVREVLASAAHLPDGRIRAVLTPWIGGQILGGFDMIGRRADDPNDRIAHEHRRSLRASWVPFAWLGEVDPGSVNTLDTVVTDQGRRFVRHYFIDFGADLGSFSTRAKGPHEGSEHIVEVGRTLGALASLGFYRRPFQDDRNAWTDSLERHAALGWFAVEGFDPDEYRSRVKVPAHMRRTARDLYWGAKVVTSFSDAQLGAVVGSARLPPRDAAYLVHALAVRRDIIGRRYLRAVTAVERPEVSAGPDGPGVCFEDLAIARGYAAPRELRYRVQVTDGLGGVLAEEELPARQDQTCVPLAAASGPGSGYRIVRVVAALTGTAGTPGLARPAWIHLRWRPAEGRFVVVGLEREDG